MFGAITGILASRNHIASVPLYFTSVLYPMLVEGDDITVDVPEQSSATLWGIIQEEATVGVASITTGVLTSTINYTTYNPVVADGVTLARPTMTTGVLTNVVNYVDYNPVVVDGITSANPTMLTGDIQVTIAYQIYSPPEPTPDGITLARPSILSGTLT